MMRTMKIILFIVGLVLGIGFVTSAATGGAYASVIPGAALIILCTPGLVRQLRRS
jgi:hypothetical protein